LNFRHSIFATSCLCVFVAKPMSIKKRVERIIIGKTEGKTLLEKMLGGKDDNATRPEDTLYNPLQLAIKDMVELTFEEAGTYEVFKITAYTTHINNNIYNSARYFLRDTVAVEEIEPLVLEVMESEHLDAPEQFLFHIIEEFEYDEEFMELLEDEFFIINEETEDEEEIEKEYEKTYHATLKVNTVGEERTVHSGGVEVWNYEREDEMETFYLTIEMDTDNGWTTIYEGRKLLEGELEIYRLSSRE
jgi:hypothetical protein